MQELGNSRVPRELAHAGAESVTPSWPAWYGPVALVASLALMAVAMTPIFLVESLVVAFTGADLGRDGISIPVAFAGFVVQDAAAILCAVAFAGLRRRPKLWHFGLYAIGTRRALGWIAAVSVGMLVFDALYFGLVPVGALDYGYFGLDSGAWSLAVIAVAVVVLAPIAEEIFFRGFLYPALRSRFGILLAAVIDGLIFGALHYGQGDGWLVLPTIGVFGVVMCLLYERVGSLYPLIAVHAALNAIALSSDAPEAALGLGLSMVAACVLLPRWIPLRRSGSGSGGPVPAAS